MGLTGGGERVCASLLRALDRTEHNVALRCVEPPHGMRFAGNDGGGAGPAPWQPCDEACRAGHVLLRNVRLERVEPNPARPAVEIKELFAVDGRCDAIVVTDGGFIIAKTAAPRIILYCNSVLREEGRLDHLRTSRSIKGRIKYHMARRADGRVLRTARDSRIELVPNSLDTMRMIERAVGRAARAPVYPPVDLRRYLPLQSAPKGRRVATVARFAPEKNLEGAARIMAMAGERWDVVGNAVHPYQLEHYRVISGRAGARSRFLLNATQGMLDSVLGGARAYLHSSKETFGIAVAEAIAAGCVPVVPDNSAHLETVPFDELRYDSEKEAADKILAALDGRYDGLLASLRNHVRRFSEGAFQEGMMGIIEGPARRPAGSFRTAPAGRQNALSGGGHERGGMGLVSRALRRMQRNDDGRDLTLTREYWEDAAGGSIGKAVNAICDGYDTQQFAGSGGVHFDESELDSAHAVLDLACGMGRTCKRVAGRVSEYHGVDYIPEMIAKAREYNKDVPNAMFHVNDGRTLGEFVDDTFDVVYSELAFQHMPKDIQQSYAAECARVLKGGGRFFAQLPRMEFYRNAEYALTEAEARSLLSPFASVDLVCTEAYWLARAVAGAGRRGAARRGEPAPGSAPGGAAD